MVWNRRCDYNVVHVQIKSNLSLRKAHHKWQTITTTNNSDKEYRRVLLSKTIRPKWHFTIQFLFYYFYYLWWSTQVLNFLLLYNRQVWVQRREIKESLAYNWQVHKNGAVQSSTSFMSTNVKLRLRFDVHLTFPWHSPDIPLTLTWTSPDHLTIIWPSPDPYKTLT